MNSQNQSQPKQGPRPAVLGHPVHLYRLSFFVQVWVYVSDIDRFVDPLAWAGLGEAFRHVWTASAFKGAFGERLYAVNVQVCTASSLLIFVRYIRVCVFPPRKVTLTFKTLFSPATCGEQLGLAGCDETGVGRGLQDQFSRYSHHRVVKVS